MLTTLDDSPWHQLPTTFDHVGTSDPRFFDRLWFAASDRRRQRRAAIHDGRLPEHERGRRRRRRSSPAAASTTFASRAACVRVTSRAAVRSAIDVREPMKRIGLSVAPNASGVTRRAGMDRDRSGAGGAPALRPAVRTGAGGLQPLRPDRHLHRLVRGRRASGTRWIRGGRAATIPGGCASGSASPSRSPGRPRHLGGAAGSSRSCSTRPRTSPATCR